MTVAVVIPTIAGREEDLARCVDAYRATAPGAELYIERDHSSCGEAWLAGAARAEADGFDYLHLTADDLEPHADWCVPAIESADAGLIPAPLVYNPDGRLQSAGISGLECFTGPYEDGKQIDSTTVPFLRHDMWGAIGMVPLHYCTDVWVSTIGRRNGWETVIRTGMVFTHYNAEPGRGDQHARTITDRSEYLRLVEAVA